MEHSAHGEAANAFDLVFFGSFRVWHTIINARAAWQQLNHPFSGVAASGKVCCPVRLCRRPPISELSLEERSASSGGAPPSRKSSWQKWLIFIQTTSAGLNGERSPFRWPRCGAWRRPFVSGFVTWWRTSELTAEIEMFGDPNANGNRAMFDILIAPDRRTPVAIISSHFDFGH